MVKLGWDKLKRLLAQANIWTGQQTFSDIVVTGGTIGGATITEAFTTLTNPATNAAVTTTIVDSYNGVVVTLSAAGNTQTIQNPTTAATIRKFMVINNDTSNNNLSVVANSVTFTLTPGEGQCFLWDGSAWGPTDLGITDIPVKITQGGTGASTLTDHGVLLGSGADPVTALGAMTNGQLVIGSTGLDPVVASITDGEGIDITVGAGTLTIACEDAAEANKGVTVYAGTTKALAGTDTASAMTPADVKNKVAVDVNPKAMSQGVAMTVAASGSNGIAVADNGNIDYETGNFFGVISVLLDDYTPSAEVVLEQKTDGTNGRKFTLQTNGKLRVTINTTDYDSTVATGCTDNTNHVFGYSVTRETAAAAGSIIFVVDGVQLGDAVAITAGAPTTINNAVSQYVMGTSATRTAGTINGYVSGNRALTAAEHLALYRNGIAFADRWGSQTNLCMNGELTTDTTGWISSNCTINRVDSSSDPGTDSTTAGASDKWVLKGVDAGAAARLGYSYPTVIGKKYQYKTLYYRPSTNVENNGYICARESSLGGNVVSGSGTSFTISNTWTLVTGSFTATTTTTVIAVDIDSATDDVIYLDSLFFKKIGAIFALESEGIQPAPGQWLDSSSNNLHALQPATGSSLTKSKRDFTIKWTNTWAGTHELQYIGGVDQAILPPNCYIDSIIGVIAGGAIEDIIIGDGSDTDRWVTITTGLAAGTIAFTIANAISNGTNYKMTVDPDANFTGSISWTITGKIL